MQSIEKKDLDELDAKLRSILEKFPRKRRELHERLAEYAKAAVNRQTSLRLKDTHGRVQSWQQKHVGTGGGYAAVRATDESSKRYPSPGPNSPGAVTNYLENGHAVRPRSAYTRLNRKSRAEQDRVAGRYMYDNAKVQMERDALVEAKKLAEELEQELSDG